MKLSELKGKLIKASNGNVGKYACWQPTARGIRVWLEDDEGHPIGSILLKDVKKENVK